MSSSLRWVGAAAVVAGALVLGSARCGPPEVNPPTDGCVPLNGACGVSACCTLSGGGDPLVCQADGGAGTCVIQCIGRNHNCTGNVDGCCAGYVCQVDAFGYGTCK